MDKYPNIASNPKTLHVLVVSNHNDIRRKFPFSGIFIDRQVASLQKAGVKISTFDIGAGRSAVYLFRKWRELRREVRELNPDLVHARYGTVVAVLSILSGRATVITFCGSDLNSGASVSNLRVHMGRLLSNIAASGARRIICVSEGLRQALWWRKSRAIVIPDGVDLDLFSPGSRDAARKEVGWDLNRRVVLFNLGGDAKKKGFDLAKAAVEMARSRVPEIELQIVQHVEPSLMPTYYRAADVLLCTSINEGSPNVIKEALSCNLPIVSVSVGDVEERLLGVHPSAVVPRDPRAIGEAIAEILLVRERSNGREHVAHLDQDEIAKRVAALYESVLERRYTNDDSVIREAVGRS
jgi:teichuronic acid biosynthesis glycosyltransferase TuaC